MAGEARNNPREQAGYRAADMVVDGMVLGLGTGSTVLYAMERIGERMRREDIFVKGVPTSFQAAVRARDFGIPLTTLDEHPVLDLAIDGADQVDRGFNMIKGRGAALLREKCVADAAEEFVVVVDETKMTDSLSADVPVEAIPFAATLVARRLSDLGASPVIREGTKKDGPVITDNGNFIIDCSFGLISNPAELEHRINNIPGVCACGLFTSYTRKTKIVLGKKDGCSVLSR